MTTWITSGTTGWFTYQTAKAKEVGTDGNSTIDNKDELKAFLGFNDAQADLFMTATEDGTTSLDQRVYNFLLEADGKDTKKGGKDDNIITIDTRDAYLKEWAAAGKETKTTPAEKGAAIDTKVASEPSNADKTTATPVKLKGNIDTETRAM